MRCGESSRSEQIGHAVDFPQRFCSSLGPIDNSVVAKYHTWHDGPHNRGPHPTVTQGSIFISETIEVSEGEDMMLLT
jgi:hypothetical protein